MVIESFTYSSRNFAAYDFPPLGRPGGFLPAGLGVASGGIVVDDWTCVDIVKEEEK